MWICVTHYSMNKIEPLHQKGTVLLILWGCGIYMPFVCDPPWKCWNNTASRRPIIIFRHGYRYGYWHHIKFAKKFGPLGMCLGCVCIWGQSFLTFCLSRNTTIVYKMNPYLLKFIVHKAQAKGLFIIWPTPRIQEACTRWWWKAWAPCRPIEINSRLRTSYKAP